MTDNAQHSGSNEDSFFYGNYQKVLNLLVETKYEYANNLRLLSIIFLILIQ